MKKFNSLDLFADMIKEELEMNYPEHHIMIRKVRKNNDHVLTSVIIQPEKLNIGVVIYIDDFYEKYKNGVSISEILNEIAIIYNSNKKEQNFDVNYVLDFANAHKKLYYKLVNREKNKERLKDIPYIPFKDLAIIFYIEADEDKTVIVNNSIMNEWNNPDIIEIYRIAKGNTQIKYKKNIFNLYEEFKYVYVFEEDDEYVPMYVITNTKKLNGAGVILYDNLLKEFSEKIGGDFYILPSSIHELICIPVTDKNTDELKEMVTEINMTVVNQDEVLSNNVYRYYVDKDLVEIV